MLRKKAIGVWLLGASFLTLAVAAGWLLGSTNHAPTAKSTDQADAIASQTSHFPVTIRQPAGPPRVDLGTTDVNGNAATASCSTCHANRRADARNKTATDLDEFHQGLKFAHGKVSCLSCHNASDYDSLTLADGTAVAYSNVMTLCAQCHGPQTRDYQHGAHGGMAGHWDLSQGPRTRNNCVDCHDPHAPAFPKMSPTFKPRDRFLQHSEH